MENDMVEEDLDEKEQGPDTEGKWMIWDEIYFYTCSKSWVTCSNQQITNQPKKIKGLEGIKYIHTTTYILYIIPY